MRESFLHVVQTGDGVQAASCSVLKEGKAAGA
jgi:hypothetical protein